MNKICLDDLLRSGLLPGDIGAKEAGAPELAAIKVPANIVGYLIPYYDINGTRIPFYRARLFGFQIKYKQPSGTANHVYFPPQFATTLQKHLLVARNTKTRPFIIITEGEKKAAAAVKQGFPACALGGVDSWRGRTIILPKHTVFSQDGTHIRAKIPAGFESTVTEGQKAVGLQDLFDLCLHNGITLLITYDTDSMQGVKHEVQRAAALLAHEAHACGCPLTQIRQLVFPFDASLGKVGVDDYLQSKGAKALRNLVLSTLNKRSAFPRLPNAKKYINDKLQMGKLRRDETQMVAATMLAELEARGRRIRSTSDGTPYYFDEQSCKLIPAQLTQKPSEPFHESLFGGYLYKEFGVGAADQKTLQWLASQFTGEDPIEDAEPRRVLALPPGDGWEIAVQVSDSHFAIISADKDYPLRIHTNGTRGLLFEQGHVVDTNIEDLQDAFHEQLEQPAVSWWYEIFSKDFMFRGGDISAQLATLLFYISPFLLRWKGTQLPVELFVGEPGSGKSSLYALRLTILTGQPLLRNVPTDLRDWFSSIVSTGGIHIIDNAQFTNKDIRQRISDEMCRIVTEPNPHIEMRKLFTTNTQYQLPVSVVFGMTSIQQPFLNTDLLQRAAVFELDAIRTGHHSDWVQKQLQNRGGRVSWLAHHFVMLHRFLAAAKETWVDSYVAGHRLANYEQCLGLMAKVLDLPRDKEVAKASKKERKSDVAWVKQSLAQSTEKAMIESDWTYNGLKVFVEHHTKVHPDGITVRLHDITAWFEASQDYHDHPLLTNPRMLIRYIQSNRTVLERTLNLEDVSLGVSDPAQKKYFVRP